MDRRSFWVRRLTSCFLLPLAAVLIMNTFFSGLKSTYFELYLENEIPSYQNDRWNFMISGLLAVGGFFFLLYRRIEEKQIKARTAAIAACIWAAMVCLCFVFIFRCKVVADAASASTAAVQFIEGNYESLYDGYLSIYPFQIGMVSFLEVFYRIFGMENFIVFQLVNTAAITLIVHFLPKFSERLFKDEGIVRLTAVLSTVLFPLFLYSTYVYGDIPGFALGVLAIYFTLLYLEKGDMRYAVFTGLTFMAGIPIKGNNLIFVVAAVIAVFLKMLMEGCLRRLLGIFVIILCSQIGNLGLEAVYLQRTGLDEFPQGTPKLSWVAMGMQPAREGDNGCGWYNGYNYKVYKQSGFVHDLAKEESMESIFDSIERFWKEPQYTAYYFYHKFTSQWNDPTYQAQIMNEWYSRHVEEPSEFSVFFNYGKGRSWLFELMNVAHFTIFFFSSFGIVIWIKRWSLTRAYYLLNLFGGVVFHTLIWEAKGRYVLPYYVLMLPVAATGAKWIFDHLSMYGQKRKAAVSQKHLKEEGSGGS